MARLSRIARALAGLLDPLTAGARALILRLVARFGWRAVLLGAAVAVYSGARYQTWIPWGIAAFCAAAWMHAPGPDEQEAGEELPVETPLDPLPDILWELIGEAPGVHLPSIVDHLHKTGLDTACDRADVRAALTRRGIPIRGSVRDADGRVNQGVHRADLKAWEQARSPACATPLPKGRSNAATTALTSDVAEAPTAVATPPTPAD
jgi:hypothetical protein